LQLLLEREVTLGCDDGWPGARPAGILRANRMRAARLYLLGLPLVAALVAAACSDGPPPVSPADGAGADASLPVDATMDDVAWDHVRVAYDGGAGPSVTRVPVKAELTSRRADVQPLMFASGEMQQSGEPFAEHFAGRNLSGYDRTLLPTDQYTPNAGAAGAHPMTDLFGYSTAVESYEYSKYHMNTVSQWSTAGLSLVAGPIVVRRPEATPLARLRARAAELFTASGSDIAGYTVVPAPASNPLNYLGFQGLWPAFAPFRSFDPGMVPSAEVIGSCTLDGGYGGIPTIGSMLPEYECAYNTLHLTDRDGQVDKTLVPGVLGLSTWKEALWTIDFAGRLHDARSNPVDAVSDADRRGVGTRGNKVVGAQPAGAASGTYLGSTPLEDVWGLVMIEEMDNAAELLVGRLTTTDGATLGGFASKTEATAYDYTSQLRWFPAAVTVTEDAPACSPSATGDAGSAACVPFPSVTRLAIGDATSRSTDLSALLLGHAMFFGMTDPRNAGIGQLVGLNLTFDGDPFPADDGKADGEETAHDRALAVLRVALVDLDRMHSVALTHGSVIADTSTVSGGIAHPGTTVTTTALGHLELALRQALLAVNGAITQYGAADPDPGADALGILNAPAIHPTAPGAAPTFSGRVRQLIAANGAFVRDVLTQADGTVANAATIANGVATATPGATTLESQGAAVRALVEAFLVTGDVTFRDRARAVASHLEAGFYSRSARMYRGVEGGKDEVHMTPERFGWLQSALRETHKVLHVDGDRALGRDVLEDRIARINKLFLNGWDDLNGDEHVDRATECLGARLQLAEQALTGELGIDDFGKTTTDRDADCVPEITSNQTGAVLAADVWFHAP
jgi:hypothetical protein